VHEKPASSARLRVTNARIVNCARTGAAGAPQCDGGNNATVPIVVAGQTAGEKLGGVELSNVTVVDSDCSAGQGGQPGCVWPRPVLGVFDTAGAGWEDISGSLTVANGTCPGAAKVFRPRSNGTLRDVVVTCLK